MLKIKKSFLVSILLGFMVMILVGVYLSSLEDKYIEAGKRVKVLVAKEYIAPYSVINEDLVQVVDVPNKFCQPGALTSLKDLLDEKGRSIYSSIIPIMGGEQIVATKLAMFGEETGLSIIVPKGKRAVSIKVDDVSGVSGLIKPGDYVDVIGTFDYTEGKEEKSETVSILQNVLVLAVGQEVIGGASKKAEKAKKKGLEELIFPTGSENTVTLALTFREAQIVTFAQEKSTLKLLLHASGEKETVSASPVGLDSIIEQKGKGKIKLREKEEVLPSIIRGVEEEKGRAGEMMRFLKEGETE